VGVGSASMGEMIEFPSNGGTAHGYAAYPEAGAGPALVVIQEWWGLVDHIKDVCDRFAAEGFTALAPDLYRGETTTEPDEAGKLMMALNLEHAAKALSGAVDWLVTSDKVRGEGVGVVGYCMGGGLALVLGCQRPDQVRAVAPYYGVIPWEAAQPDYSKMTAAVQGHYAENDDFASPDAVRALEGQLKDLGVEVEMFIYPNTFNDARPEVYDEDAAHQAWNRTLSFLRSKLG
jgi:carboxymethylenebutenolidase